MKTVLLYKSKSGFTKSYVDYIQQDLNCDVFFNKHLDESLFEKYDTIIYGGGLYVSGINGIKFIKKNLKKLETKNLIVFFVGATPGRDEEITGVIENNFSIEEHKYIKFFYFRGGFNYKKLTLIDKFLMILLKAKIQLKRNRTSDEQGMLNSYSKPLDFTSKEKVKPLVDYVKNL